jgi:hypothetical protein
MTVMNSVSSRIDTTQPGRHDRTGQKVARNPCHYSGGSIFEKRGWLRHSQNSLLGRMVMNFAMGELIQCFMLMEPSGEAIWDG